GDQLVVLARGVDLRLPLLAARALEAQEPGRVVLRVRERRARVGRERGIGGGIVRELVDERVEVAARLGQLADEHLRLGALEAQRARLRGLRGGQQPDRLAVRVDRLAPRRLGGFVAGLRRDLARGRGGLLGARDGFRRAIDAQAILSRSEVIRPGHDREQEPREDQHFPHCEPPLCPPHPTQAPVPGIPSAPLDARRRGICRVPPRSFGRTWPRDARLVSIRGRMGDAGSDSGRRRAAIAGLILLATVVAYLPVFRAGFIWGDDGHVTPPALRSLAGLARIWTEPRAAQQYYPLLHTAFW